MAPTRDFDNREEGRLGDWETGRLRDREAGRLAGWETRD
jgi:hypothetical protein